MSRKRGGDAVVAAAGGASEGTAQLYPVKKAQFGNLFTPMPTEVSVVSGRWQDYSPTQVGFTPLEFLVPKSDQFIDLNMCELILKCKLENEDDSSTSLDNAALADTSVINNIGHSMIKHMEIKLNDTSTGEPTDMQAYKAYNMVLLNFTPEQKKSYLQIEGWYDDTPGDDATMNETVTTASGAGASKNKGLVERAKWFIKNAGESASKAVLPSTKFIIQPLADIFQTSRYLVPGVAINIRITFNKPEFFMMRGTSKKGVVKMVDAKLRIRHVEAAPSVKAEVREEMIDGQKVAIYPLRTTKPIVRVINSGRQSEDFTDIFQQHVPDRFVMGMVAADAYNGAYNKNPFNYRFFGLKSMRVLVNGYELPLTRYEFSESDYVEGYETLFSSTKMHRGKGLGITREGYKNGFALLDLNLTPDGKDASSYTYKKNEGTVDISLEFKDPLTANVALIITPEYENELLIDPLRVVRLRKNY